MGRKYKFLEHTADVKFLASGKTPEKLFMNSALALKESMCGKIKVGEKIKKSINIRGKDFEALLYRFLEEILFMLDAENFIIARVSRIKIGNKFDLKATVIGDKASEYEFTNPVKAVTYNDMFVKKEIELVDTSQGKKEKENWTAQVVLDV
ncbi:MAG TPA: archease [Candidatus Nanoarchaeia archaeon]|nr:archease [Candidatus Nanoarchaeia archaeon]